MEEDIKLSDCKIKTIHEICDKFDNKANELINILHGVQEVFGYLPREVQEVVADKLKLNISHVYGVVSFYSFFNMTPRGEYPISVCMGTACYVRGAEKVLEEFERVLDIKIGETTEEGKFSMNTLRCVGACGLAPVVTIGKKIYGRVTPDDIKSILKEYS